MSVGTDTGYLVYRGRSPWSWVKRLLNPVNYWKYLKRVRATYPRRARVLLMLIPLHFKPDWAARFSQQKLLPHKSLRLEKTPDPMDDFEIDWDRTSAIEAWDNVTVVQKGISFDRSRIDGLPGPVCVINWSDKLDREDVIYATADDGYLRRYIAAGMFPILFVEVGRYDMQGTYFPWYDSPEVEKMLDDPRIDHVSFYHKSIQHPDSGMPATSGLACMVALRLFSKSIEAYGWDFFLSFAPARSGYLKSLFGTFCNFRMELQSQFIENSIFNWHYAYRFSLLPNFKNHGFLGGLEKHPGINDRLDKIFYDR